jgi:hypothetical protein
MVFNCVATLGVFAFFAFVPLAAAWGAGPADALPARTSESTPTKTRFMDLSPELLNWEPRDETLLLANGSFVHGMGER